MGNYVTGAVFIGAAVLIGLYTRNLTGMSAGAEFGSLGAILVLVIIGFKFIQAGERDRVRGSRKGKSKGFVPPPPGGAVAGGPTKMSKSGGGFGSSPAAEKFANVVMIGGVLALLGVGASFFLLKSDLQKLAAIEKPKSVEAATKLLDPLLDDLASEFEIDREEAESELLIFWEENAKALKSRRLKPAAFCRELVAAAPSKEPDLVEVAEKIVKQKPAARMARLHKKVPKFGKYPAKGEFQTYIRQISEKTGASEKTVAAVIIWNWKKLFEQKKRNRKFNLLWFTKLVHSNTQEMSSKEWKKKVSKIRKGQ